MAKLIDITGKALSGEWGTDDETGDGIPVLRTTNFTNEGIVNYNDVVTRTITKKNIDDKFLRKGDIIIEKSGGSDKFPVGRVIYFDGEEKTYLFNNFTGLLRVKEQDVWYPRYVFYSLYANYKRGGTRAFENKTTGLHNLKTDDYVSRYEVAEIDKTEQISICEKLDKLYGIIKSRERELQLLNDLIKARFVELFGNPVSNPKGWERVTVDECVDSIDNGKSFVCDSMARIGEEPAILKLSAATYGVYKPEENKAIINGSDFIKGAEVHSGDLLFTRKNTPELVGMAAYVFTTPKKLMMPDLIFRINTKQNCRKIYLWKLINHELFRSQIQSLASGSAKSMSNISKERLGKLHICLPPLDLQIEFEEFVIQINKSKVAVRKY